MHHYTRVSILDIPNIPDGEPILVMGRYDRYLGGATLTQRGLSLDLVGDPYDWLPEQDTAIEVWGVLWQGQRPRLMVHDARPLGDTGRQPQSTPDPCVGDTVTLTARVMQLGDRQVCLTVDRQSYVLLGEELDERLYLISGEVLALRPPTLRLAGAVPITTPAPPSKGEQA